MENSPENSPKEEIEPANDKEIVDSLIRHISVPCKTEVDGKIYDIGDSYICEAKKMLSTMTDEAQRIRLQKCIDIYEGKYNQVE